jgi:archaellum component FlaG (FlaF/FlaG flagellin family)
MVFFIVALIIVISATAVLQAKLLVDEVKESANLEKKDGR